VDRVPVRVRVKIEEVRGSGVIYSEALLKTGFTSEELDIHIPRELARELGLWPPPRDASLEILDTAGGETLSYFIPSAVRLTVIEEDETSKTITCNVIVSLREKEVLLSDAVVEELGIEILSPKTGIWRFKGEEKLRRSV
jgi:predicted aspartyl protease